MEDPRSIIDQLKKNEKPFCFISLEMREKAKEIGKAEFHWLDPMGDWIPTIKDHHFTSGCTYRLRSDYQEEQEIVEFSIFEKDGMVKYKQNLADGNDIGIPIDMAGRFPGFIGFKANGWIWGRAYKNKCTGIMSLMIRADQLDGYEVVDMTNANVLFRGQ